MNGYDWDRTILKGNSVCRFSLFCFWRLPYLWLLLPWLFVAVVLRALRILKKDAYLQMLEAFILFVPHREKYVQRFWDKNQKRIKMWYKEVHTKQDIVVSASPAYLIEPICARLGVQCITSQNNARGRVIGPHCYGERKIEFFRSRFGDTSLAAYYSDSMSDVPMFKYAQKGYLVKGEKVTLVYQDGQKVQ